MTTALSRAATFSWDPNGDWILWKWLHSFQHQTKPALLTDLLGDSAGLGNGYCLGGSFSPTGNPPPGPPSPLRTSSCTKVWWIIQRGIGTQWNRQFFYQEEKMGLYKYEACIGERQSASSLHTAMVSGTQPPSICSVWRWLHEVWGSPVPTRISHRFTESGKELTEPYL